jgi:glycerol uptake facilitator-like aquaporin
LVPRRDPAEPRPNAPTRGTCAAAGQWLAEFIATFGLLLAILGCAARNAPAIPYAVGLYITAAYWFTASTSFTIARSISDSFAGVAPGGVIAFIAAQFAGMLAAVLLARWLWTSKKTRRFVPMAMKRASSSVICSSLKTSAHRA